MDGFFLDVYVDKPVSLMAVAPDDDYDPDPVIWKDYTEIVSKYDEDNSEFEYIEI